MEGVGTIQKNQAGIYEFIPGVFITPKIDDFPKQIKDKSFDEVSFETERKPNNSGRNLMIVLAALVAVLLFLGIYYLIFKRKHTEQVTPVKTTIVADTTKKDTIKKISPDTTLSVPKPVIQKDSNNFTIVIKTYTSNDAAEKAHTKLSSYGHQLTVEKIDSTKFELGMNFKRKLSDTTKVRDSLKIFFGGTPVVKVKPE
jgi:hypothetical protein